MVNQMSNPWNEWQKMAKSSGMIAGISKHDKRNLYSAAKANLLETDLPLTGTTIFESAIELRDTGLVTKSPQPMIYKSPFAAAARGLSSRTTTPGSIDFKGSPIAPETNWSGYSFGDEDDAASRFANELELLSPSPTKKRRPRASKRESDETKESDDEEAKEGGDEAKEGGEEAKEDTEKSDLRRTAPMDDEERKQALRSILGNYADRDSLVDDMGLPLGKERREHRSSPCRGIWQQTDESQGCEGSQGEGNHFGCGQAGRRSTSSPHEASPRTLIRR